MSRRFADFSRPAKPDWGWLDTFFVVLAAMIGVLSFLFIATLFLLTGTARAHDTGKGWSYPWECCHDQDCAEISESRVKPEAGGYLVDGRFHVSQPEVRYLPDGRYHACFPNPDTLRCFFAPPSGA